MVSVPEAAWAAPAEMAKAARAPRICWSGMFGNVMEGGSQCDCNGRLLAERRCDLMTALWARCYNRRGGASSARRCDGRPNPRGIGDGIGVFAVELRAAHADCWVAVLHEAGLRLQGGEVEFGEAGLASY